MKESKFASFFAIFVFVFLCSIPVFFAAIQSQEEDFSSFKDLLSSPKANASSVGTSLFVVASTDLVAHIQWAVPELRVGAPETNDDSEFYLAVYSSSEDGDPSIFRTGSLLTSNVDGTYTSNIPLVGIEPGTYDVIFKGHQTLAKKLNDIELTEGLNVLNFSTLDNAPEKGSEVLLGGDISNDGDSPSNLGDNVVNSIDISVLLADIDETDPDGNGIRANINQDNTVNSVDMSILLKNLDAEGDNS